MNDETPHHHEYRDCPQIGHTTTVSDQVMKGIMMLIVPWSVWVTHSIYDILSLHKPNGTEFSVKDAHHLEKEVLAEIEKINDKIWVLEGKVTSEYVKESELILLLENKR